MTNQKIISSRFPYLPIRITIQQRSRDVEALLDTGFDGDALVPNAFFVSNCPPDEFVPWVFADGSQGWAPGYTGIIEIGAFGSFQALVMVMGMGNAILLGRGFIDRFTVTLDHGQRVIVEP